MSCWLTASSLKRYLSSSEAFLGIAMTGKSACALVAQNFKLWVTRTMHDNISILAHFGALADPRIDRSKRHKLVDILTIAVCAVIANASGWEDIETFAEARVEWFKKFLELPNGIPSHDTFRRVFARLNPKAFQKAALGWVAGIAKITGGEVIPIDGKTARRSFDRSNSLGALHFVSAWSAVNQLTLGQIKVNSHSNEIPAISSLLDLLEIHGCIVTIDAMGCQRDIATKIIEHGGDYLLALKGNQKTICDEVNQQFQGADADQLTKRLGDPVVTVDGDHGRIETRTYWTSCDLSVISNAADWSGLKAIGIVERKREKNADVSTERQYYLLSFCKTERFAKASRSHWGIESMHWCLDMTFNEDQSRIRNGEAPENFSLLRRLALSLLKNIDPKLSVAKKRYKASLDERYLFKLLAVSQQLMVSRPPLS